MSVDFNLEEIFGKVSWNLCELFSENMTDQFKEKITFMENILSKVERKEELCVDDMKKFREEIYILIDNLILSNKVGNDFAIENDLLRDQLNKYNVDED